MHRPGHHPRLDLRGGPDRGSFPPRRQDPRFDDRERANRGSLPLYEWLDVREIMSDAPSEASSSERATAVSSSTGTPASKAAVPTRSVVAAACSAPVGARLHADAALAQRGRERLALRGAHAGQRPARGAQDPRRVEARVLEHRPDLRDSTAWTFP